MVNSLTREMWFPIRVCDTPHQILRYSLQGKGWELMLSEFPNACFIFDEIHAYEPRIIGLDHCNCQIFRKSQWKMFIFICNNAYIYSKIFRN